MEGIGVTSNSPCRISYRLPSSGKRSRSLIVHTLRADFETEMGIAIVSAWRGRMRKGRASVEHVMQADVTRYRTVAGCTVWLLKITRRLDFGLLKRSSSWKFKTICLIIALRMSLTACVQAIAQFADVPG